jgi:hypothetical protein
MSSPFLIRSFAAGELAPSMGMRADLAKYTIGLRTCRNFIVQKHGGVANRAGTRFVGECKTNSTSVHLLRYVSENDGESILIEAGDGYLRFYQNGGLVTVDQGALAAWSGATAYVVGDLVKAGGVAYYSIKAGTNHAVSNTTYWYPLEDDIYEIPTPFTGAAYRFKWTQSGRMITLTHPSVQPHDLVFQALDRWVLVPLDTKPKVTPPVGGAISGTSAGGRTFAFKITAAAPGTYEESEPSASIVAAGISAPTEANPLTLTWTPTLVPLLTGTVAPEYYIYCDPYVNGTFGFVGTATGAASFKFVGVPPDFSITPPIPTVLFTTADNYPSCSAFPQQRRGLFNTNTYPDASFLSRVGFPDNFGIASPLQDDDAISFRIAGESNHPIHWALALKQLVLMTGEGIFTVGRPKEPLSPSDIPNDQDTYVGASALVRPIVIGNSVVYVQSRGSTVHDVQFQQEVEGLAGRDLTVFASHLFKGKAIRDADYAITPDSIAWFVRNDGVLLGLTYIREQDIQGWHRHDTEGGDFYRVCVVPEAGEDVPYVVVRRDIGDSTESYIEKLERRTISTWNEDVFFVDAGLSYQGAAVTTIGGLDHLEGEVVAVVADGEVLYDGDPDGADAGLWTVHDGAVSLNGWTPAAGVTTVDIHAGLRMVADLQTLDLDVGGSNVRTKQKRLQWITAHLDESSRVFKAGPSSTKLKRFRRASTDSSDQSFSGSVELLAKSEWEVEGRVFLRQSDPLPITVLGVTPHFEVGGA